MPNWTSANNSDQFPTWNSKEDKAFKAGATLEGVLTEKRSHIGPNDSNVYIIEETDGGKKQVWGTTLLDRVMEPMPIGTLVRFTYKGIAKSKKGNSYHDFAVDYDKDTRPEVDITA